MSVNWKPSTEEAHAALPSKRHPRAKDPAWEEVMGEIGRERVGQGFVPGGQRQAVA